MNDVRLRGSRKASEVRDGVAGLEFLQRGTERLFCEAVKGETSVAVETLEYW